MEATERFIKEYLEGKSVKDIGKENNVTGEAVYLRLRTMPNWREVSLKMRQKRKEATLQRHKQHLSKILEMYENGFSSKEISKELKINQDVVRFLTRGTPYDNSLKAKEYRDKIIVALYKKGKTQKELAKMYGMGQTGISRIINKYNANIQGRLRPGRKSSRKNNSSPKV